MNVNHHKRQGKAGKKARQERALQRLEKEQHPDWRQRDEMKTLRERLGLS